MPALAAITSLTRLDLFGSRLTDFGVRFLAKLHHLRHIEICGGGLSDEGVRVLSSLTELRTMNLSQNGGVSDRSAAFLAELPVLESLNLSNTNIGVDALQWLRAITSLTSLALYSCAIPHSAAATLKAALPRLLTLGLDPPD